MSRFEMGTLRAAAFAAAAFVAVRAPAQDSGRVFPWPTIEKRPAPKKDPSVRRASLVEVLDHKKRLIEQASAETPQASEAVLVDEPFAPVKTEPRVPGVPMVDPTLAPAAPPPAPAKAANIPIAPPRTATTQQPAPKSTLTPKPVVTPPPAPTSPALTTPPTIAMPAPTTMMAPHVAPPGTVPVPVVIEGPTAPLPNAMAMPPMGQVELPPVDGAIVEGEGVVNEGVVNEAPGPTGGYIPSLGVILPGAYAETGLVWLRFNTRQDDTLVRTRFNGDRIVERDSRDFDSNGTGGVRVTFGMPVNCGVYLESTFMGFLDWERTRTLTGVEITHSRSSFPTIAGATFTDQQARLESRFLSSEINLKYAYSVYPMSYFIFGIRNINLNQDFEVLELGTVPVSGGRSPVAASLDVHVQNRIWGPQIGIESRWIGWTNRWSFDSFMKGGFGWNSDRARIERSISNSSAGAQAFVTSDREGDVTAFVEVNSAFTYRFSPFASFRTGYHFLGLWGYASAPLQRPNAFFDEEQRFKVDSSERAFIHGPFASLEFTWGGMR
jgi:hypothetical protein